MGRMADLRIDDATTAGAVAGLRAAASRLAPVVPAAGRTRRTVLVKALAQAADTATRLSGATARWSPRLATYQAEADALERQAAAEQANHDYLASRAPHVPQLTGDLAESATALAAIRAQARQLHQEYLATAASILTQFDLKAWWESTEDIRKYPEGALAFLDTMTADHWIATLERLAEVPGEWVKEFGEVVAEASTEMASGGFLTADLVGADLVMDAIPGVGEVAIAGTGLYLAGDFLYHHCAPFHDVANDVGHATVTAARDVGHGAATAWHSVTSSVGSWF
jgi:hypothetical protein